MADRSRVPIEPIGTRLGDAALRWSPFQFFFSRAADDGVAVLAYHGVDDAASFERHLEYLDSRFRPVTLTDVIAALGGEPLPPRAVLITFDDGDPSVFDSALPLLRRYEIPAVAFVVSGLVGSTQMLWTKEARWLVDHGGSMSRRAARGADATVRLLKQMDQEARLASLHELRGSVETSPPAVPQMGWTDLKTIDQEGLMAIEDHSFLHPQLDRCGLDDVREEIVRSTDVFEQGLGRRPRAFAYPDGAWSDEAARVLRSHGYEAAFLFDHRRARLPGSDRWGISRLRVNSTTSLDRFATILSGLHPAIHHLRGRP